MKKFPNETSTLQHRTHLRHFQRKTIPHEMSPDPDKQAKTHTHTHMRRESRNTIRFLRSLFEFPVSVERVFVRKKKKRETKRGLDKQRHDGEIFAYPLSTLVTLASNKRQGHSHWRAVCSMSSLPPLFLSSSTRLILRCQLSKTRAPFTEEESSLFPPPRWCNGLRQRIRFALFNAQSRDDDFAAGFTPGLT